jgi:uncharacterized membrane protein YheB (UPF0754 family)
MIPFFRKIRKKMADDNRPLKYMRYAVGEIVLVVIGILIALQINTWNEERKTKILERQILSNMIEELALDIDKFEKSIELSKACRDSSFKLSQALSQRVPFNDSIKELFYMITIPVFFQYNHATYENLKSEGFSIISNNKIRRSIQDLYSNKYEGALQDSRLFNDEYLLNLNDLQAKNLRVIQGNYPKNYVELQDNFEFINVLEDNAQNNSFWISNLENLDSTATSLINEIEKYLAK